MFDVHPHTRIVFGADRIDELMDSQPVAAQVAAVASAMAQDEAGGALSSAVDQLIQRAK